MRLSVAAIIFSSLLPASTVVLATTPDGYVVKVDSPTIYLDWGQASGVAVGDSFTLYRPEGVLKHPVTGEILGQQEKNLGGGVIESLQEKFSIGRLIDQRGPIVPGDRTRLIPSEASVSASTPTPSSPSTTNVSELWRSAPLDGEPVAIAIGDIEGVGQQDIALATRHTITLYHWNGKGLEALASVTSGGQSEWLALDVADVDHSGHARLFANSFMNAIHRPRVEVFEWSDHQLKNVAHISGFVRAVDQPDGKPALLMQTMGFASDPRFSAPTVVVDDKGRYKPGPELSIAHLPESQLFGFTYGDWDKDQQMDLAVLDRGERLTVYLAHDHWSSPDVYGGTKNNFAFDGQTLASFLPRALRWPTAHGDQLIVLHNIPDLGLHFNYLRTYDKSELTALAWDGQGMSAVWKLSIDHYIADDALGDGLGNGTPQLWTASADGRKTILTAYRLP